MQFTEQETGAILDALRARVATLERSEEGDTLRQRYPGMTPQTRARCAKRVDEYRARREKLEALIARFEYVGCES